MKHALPIVAVIIIVMTMAVLQGQDRSRYSPERKLAWYAVDTAANDTYVASVPGAGSYFTGMFVLLNPVTDNTGACTLNINGIGAKSIKTVLGDDPGDSHIDAAQIVPLCYDGTNFVLMTPDSNP